MYAHNINTLYTRICSLILQAFQPESSFDWRQRKLSGSSLLIRHKLIYILYVYYQIRHKLFHNGLSLLIQHKLELSHCIGLTFLQCPFSNAWRQREWSGLSLLIQHKLARQGNLIPSLVNSCTEVTNLEKGLLVLMDKRTSFCFCFGIFCPFWWKSNMVENLGFINKWCGF